VPSLEVSIRRSLSVAAPARVRRICRHVAGPLLALSLTAPVAHGQGGDTLVTPLVFSPSRYAQSALEAPSVVTVLTAEEIWRFGYRTLDEVLGAVRGMFSVNDRNFSYLNVRGVFRSGDFNTRLLLLLDGRRLNNLLDDFAGLGTDGLVDIEAIERVEVVHGPGSSLYGTNAFYAVINIITRRGSSAPGATIRADLQSQQTLRSAVRYGHRTSGGVDFFASAGASTSRGATLTFPELATADRPDGRIAGLDDDRSARAMASVRAGDVHVLAAVAGRNKGIPTAAYLTTPGDDRTGTSEQVALLSVQYEHVFADLSRVWATASGSANRDRGRYAYPTELLVDESLSRTGLAEAQYLRFFGRGHTITVGGEARASGTGSIVVEREGDATPIADVQAPSHVVAGFVQANLQLLDAVAVNLGMRHDRYSSDLSAWSPRIAVVWSPSTRTAIKFSVGRAFRAPNPFELHYNDGGITQVQPIAPLRPERLSNRELSVEHALSARLGGTLSIYDTKVRDLIGMVPVAGREVFAFDNLDRQGARGVEAALQGRPGRGIRLDASAAVQRARDLGTNDALVGAPSFVSRAAASVPMLHNRVHGIAEWRAISARPTLAGARTPAFSLLNLGFTVGGRRTTGPTLNLMLWNALGTRAFDPGGEEHIQDQLPRDGRTVRAALRWSF
jgi:outer membrane receptor for ferrienterochelin and colicins